MCYGNCIHLTIHVIFGFNKLSSVDFSSNCFARNDMAFSLSKKNTFQNLSYTDQRDYFGILITFARSLRKINYLTSCNTFIGTPMDILVFYFYWRYNDYEDISWFLCIRSKLNFASNSTIILPLFRESGQLFAVSLIS